MNRLEKIQSLLEELKQQDAKIKELNRSIVDGASTKYGIIPMNFTNHGFNRDFERYEEQKSRIVQSINYEYTNYLSELSIVLSKTGIGNIILYDYSVPFYFDDEAIGFSNHDTFESELNKILYLIIKDPTNTNNLREIEGWLIKSGGVFNQNHVVLNNGKPYYKKLIFTAKDIISHYKLITKGYLNVICKGIREILEMEFNEENSNRNRSYDYNSSITTHRLRHLVICFIQDSDLNDKLIALDGQKNLDANMKLVNEVRVLLQSEI